MARGPVAEIPLTEAQYMRRITDYCDWLGLKWHHETDSRRSKSGFPDLVIVGSCVIWAEIKTDKGRVSVAQAAWWQALEHAGAEYYLWRPRDWPNVEGRLLGMVRG